MLQPHELNMLRTIAKGIAAQFGPGCEVVVHEISEHSAERSIVAIENGHVTGRKLGDGPSQVVLEQLGKPVRTDYEDHLAYLTRTSNGKLLKSSTMYMRGEDGAVKAIFCINYDISALALANTALGDLLNVQDRNQEPEEIPNNVNDLLDELIDRSVRLVGKPVELMTKEDKIAAIRFLSDSGALLITKSGDKIAKFFGISKYTLYSYLDSKQEEKNND